jgi:hypothetical protein
MEKRSVYISGKITGLEVAEFEKNFSDAEETLKEMGFAEVINPCTLDHCHGKTWEEYMLEDIKALFYCDAIYMLSNWKQSRGARIEFFIALEMGKIILHQKS